MDQRIYLDHNASSPIQPAACAALAEALALHGNASSIHGEGRALRGLIENARHALAQKLECEARQIVFTSGATEAAALALSPKMRVVGRDITISRLFVSAVEHPCVLSGGRFAAEEVTVLSVDENGLLSPDTVEAALGTHDFSTGLPLVAVMLANNETGVIQPVREIAEAVHGMGGLLLVDAVQGLLKIAMTPAQTGADMLIYSSHKIGGPQGAGALVLANGAVLPEPLMKGGGQESHLRAGTENAAAIVAFAAAAGALYPGAHVKKLRDFIEAELRTICKAKAPGAGGPVIFGANVERLDNTSCFAIPGIGAESALISLDLAGIALSSGSACSSGRVGKSHVLSAMGVSDDLAKGALRISLGPGNDMGEARRFTSAIGAIVEQHLRAKRVAARV